MDKLIHGLWYGLQEYNETSEDPFVLASSTLNKPGP